jgi:hypothetical protein
MVNMKKWMLGAAVMVGALGLGTSTAQAARVGIYVGGPVAYVPPCPGPGYSWAAGYYANGYWIPGRWNYIGFRGAAPVARFGFYGRDFDRHFDRDHYRGWVRDRDHFRR